MSRLQKLLGVGKGYLERLPPVDVHKLLRIVLMNLTYIVIFYVGNKLAWLYQYCVGDSMIERLMVLILNFQMAFSRILPSMHKNELLVGITGAVAVKLMVYMKGKNAKKFRQGVEYGSARWGTAKDIAPFIDPVFENNILLTMTERLTMNGRPKNPKFARNKNVIVIGGSGSGKTRFYVKPNLMQMGKYISYVVTDPRLIFETAYGNEAKDAVKREAEKKKKSALQKLFQKKRYQKQYQAARQSKKVKDAAITSAQKFTEKAKDAVKMVAAQNRGIFATVAVFALIFVLIAASFTSCTASLQGASSAIISTSYSSTDEDIYAAENAYRALEEALNTQINQMESTHPDYDEYRYQIDEIGHNPYQLISYLTVKYGGFTYDEVAEEIKEIFRQQYGITTDSTRETVTETKTVRVGESLGLVVTSGYCNCPICCGQWSGGPTASGAMPTANHTIAVDAANPFVPIGTHVVMNGVEYVVEDTGAFARYGVQFDVYYDNHAAASAHGHQTWEAYIADSNGNQEVQVTTTKEVNRLDVTMTNHSLDAVLRSRMTEEEQERYDAYNKYYGNRDYLFDLNSIPTGSSGFGYDIPADALSDPQFAKMIQEAEKYLGVPYVWGGYSPSGFDCSGFVSWVINNCGNGWNVGRCTADELRSHCSQVSPSEAKPGDLIFFQGTYDTPGASHVGIYVGNNMMIHCGKPVQYTSIASAYWQEHFMAFGRLH